MERYVCIHGHFYQPPRENPWLETIELQDSAYPYHDWNERITAECYGPNAASRILDDQGRIIRIVNNYSRISFNFGPTLLDWMVKHAPEVYQAVLEADRESMERFSGHGSALAQAYNHMILPLASPRDKRTQILWGIAHFRYHFGRSPEGIWLPETAVDLETLDICSEQGIRFTILAPRQARRTRAKGKRKWMDVIGARINPTAPYLLKLPSGRRIVLFFYDGPISRSVAFEGLLGSGEAFARRIMDGFSEHNTGAQLVNIATDGESYGHHRPHGDMALAYALHYLESREPVRLTNYGEFLERHPPKHEVEIFENSSWSCIHGVERWRRDCGCNSGGRPQWSQAWRQPLRETLDWLRDTLVRVFEEATAAVHVRDPWEARDDYIRVVLDRSSDNIDDFLRSRGIRDMDRDQRSAALKLFEMQRHAMLMYTSCGWFFDDLSRIETLQVIRYAGRALQLAEDRPGNLEACFLERLERAKSNIAAQGDGRRIYEKFVRPSMVDLKRVGAHYAMSSMFEDYSEKTGVTSYEVTREFYESAEAGKAKLAVGRIRVSSEITLESGRFCFAILHWGDHNITGCVRKCQGGEPAPETVEHIFGHFARADFTATLREMEEHMGSLEYSLRTLFRDEQRKILDIILDATLKDIEGLYRQVYEGNAPLLRFLKDLDIPRPDALWVASDLVTTADLRRAFQEEEPDLEALAALLETASMEGTRLDAPTLEMVARKKMEQFIGQVQERPSHLPLLEKMNDLMDLVQALPFDMNLRTVQNQYYRIYQRIYPQVVKRAEGGDEQAGQWLHLFTSLGEKLSVNVTPRHPEGG